MDYSVAVEFKDVSFQYQHGSKGFLMEDISFSVPQGTKFAIAGPNGAGKTTLLKMIVGLNTPIKGEVRVFDKIVNKENFDEIRREVGFVFQNPDNQVFATTCFEDVAFGPRNLGLPENEVEEIVYDALRKMGMEEWKDYSPFNLSFGQKKRVAIAGVLAMDPKMLIFDEPYANLDLPTTIALIKLLNEITQEKELAILFASHDQRFHKWSENLLVLNRGKMIFCGPTVEGLQNEIVKEALGDPSELDELLGTL
ncbi:ABC transporter ATP-binding protein [Candidatus Borrarchaeum sp.]|uniref:energy-coupling factor ABC transporter ATP-binding protein n=1 Tax=Candidatus Borrarchaeum sp. TaxID=2846742 RepID=UPI00257B3B0A|nr:ABC transporter ATP-binding protein [Candidatus Borrarchaeum sp.]